MHKRFGSVLFHKDCNLMKALSSALGKQLVPVSSGPIADTTEEDVDSVALYLNGMLHEQSKSLTSEYKFSPSNLSNLSLHRLVDNLDPKLLRFIQKLTSARYKKPEAALDHSASEVECMSTKEIRQVYALCVLLFCTDSTCT